MFVTGRYQLADRAQIATSNDAGSRGWAASGGTGRNAMPWDESRVRIGQELLQHRAWAVKQRDRGTKRQVARVQAGQRDPELASLIVIPRIEGRLGCGLKCRPVPVAAGILAWVGVSLSPAVGAILMSASAIVVALNA